MASSELSMIGDEKVVVTLQTEMYAQSNNIIKNFFAKFFGIFATLFGVKRTGQLTITTKRIVLEQHQRLFWCFDTAAIYSTLMPNSIANVDYAFKGQILCCCRKYMFSFTTSSGAGYEFVLKGGKNQAIEITNAALNTLLINR